MAYKKLPLRACTCTHCGDPYEAVDRRRLYCSPSCKTLASNARRRAAGPAAVPQLTALATPAATANADPPAASSLPFDLQTVGVVAVGSALGTLGLRAVDHLLSSPPPAPTSALSAGPTISSTSVREDPASWFPAAVLAAPAASLLVHHPQWLEAHRCLQLDYFGRRFYYQPALQCLFWECAPAQLWPLTLRAEFTRVFELDLPQLGPGTWPKQLQNVG